MAEYKVPQQLMSIIVSKSGNEIVTQVFAILSYLIQFIELTHVKYVFRESLCFLLGLWPCTPPQGKISKIIFN